MPDDHYTQAAVFEIEGTRVGIVTCLICGAAILLDPRDEGESPTRIHTKWHQRPRRHVQPLRY